VQAVEHRIVATEEAAAPEGPRLGAGMPRIERPPPEAARVRAVPEAARVRAARGEAGVRAARGTEPPLLLPERRVVPEPSLAGEARAAAPSPTSGTAEGPSVEGSRRLGRKPGAGPTVRVTIGRVEVRALFPAPEAPQPTPPPPDPRLTLDEYLKQRREGAR
jgi:hypothetical protein